MSQLIELRYRYQINFFHFFFLNRNLATATGACPSREEKDSSIPLHRRNLRFSPLTGWRPVPQIDRPSYDSNRCPTSNRRPRIYARLPLATAKGKYRLKIGSVSLRFLTILFPKIFFAKPSFRLFILRSFRFKNSPEIRIILYEFEAKILNILKPEVCCRLQFFIFNNFSLRTS